eukprot:COSAG01_NODE_369_length_18046_cov_130.301443_17_plen_77_part_00
MLFSADTVMLCCWLAWTDTAKAPANWRRDAKKRALAIELDKTHDNPAFENETKGSKKGKSNKKGTKLGNESFEAET